jgi:hypothetical protein
MPAISRQNASPISITHQPAATYYRHSHASRISTSLPFSRNTRPSHAREPSVPPRMQASSVTPNSVSRQLQQINTDAWSMTTTAAIVVGASTSR